MFECLNIQNLSAIVQIHIKIETLSLPATSHGQPRSISGWLGEIRVAQHVGIPVVDRRVRPTSGVLGLGDQSSLMRSAARKADCGISTLPTWRMRFLPFFCLSRSLRLRLTSPP